MLSAIERQAERLLYLEHGANLGPLLHVASYYGILYTLTSASSVLSTGIWIFYWVLLVLLGYSLTIGILHLHAHRRLFDKRRAAGRVFNRVLGILLAFPSLLTLAEMMVFHVINHHGQRNGPKDFGSTRGCETGWRAVRYWIRYGYLVKSCSFRSIFATDASRALKRERVWIVLDLSIAATVVITLTICMPKSMLVCWWIPFLVNSLTAGYFAWLTHAPARADTRANSSVNHVNNVLNLFIFNQGYHHIHHEHPGIHWSDIPSKFGEMDDVDDALIVPYWVTLHSSWRVLLPAGFTNPKFGARWRRRIARKRRDGTTTLPVLCYFGWI
jgi:fatty acid desaturase